MLFVFFEKVGFENFEVYIPDRHKEGYGLNLRVIDDFVKNKVDLVVTIDCGITDVAEVDKLNKNNVEVIILDHHLETEKLPKALAVVDPKQKKDKYPFKMLCGAGVAFKTVQALIDKGGFNIVPGWEKWLLDLVAIATVADMVPLTDENRILVHYGLKVLKKTKRIGLLPFFSKFGLTQDFVDEDDIAFTIAPKINLASRMDHADTSYSLLTTKSPEEARWIVGRLEGLNKDRRDAVENILKEIDSRMEDRERPLLVVEGDFSWNVGVLGLTAHRVIEKYNCPVFLWSLVSKDEAKGSCRSDGSVNLVELMGKLPKGILIDFGGHAMSAGFSVDKDKIDQFEKELIKAFKKMDKKEVDDLIWIDKEIKMEEVNNDFLETVEKFAPFGIDHQKPIFLFKNLDVLNVKMFGNGGIHMQLDFGMISAIGFFMSNGDGCKYDVKQGSHIDLVANLERNTFRGRNEVRLRVVDLKVK